MNEFLNPKSMATPGAAGAVIMLITNALCYSFPEFSGRYIALALSFVIGTVVFSASAMMIWERSIFWIFNSLIIFSVGFGTANFAANVTTKQAPLVQGMSENAKSVALEVMSLFVSNALAQDVKGLQASAPRTKQPKLSSQVELQEAKIKVLQAQVNELQTANKLLLQKDLTQPQLQKTAPAKALEKNFFKQW